MASPYRPCGRIHKTLCSPSALSKPTRGSAPKREVWCSPEHAMGMSVGCMQPSRASAASHANNWRRDSPMLLHRHQRPDAGLCTAQMRHCHPLPPYADGRAIRLKTMIWCSAGAHDTASASKTLQQICQREIDSRTQQSRIQLAIGLPAKHSALLPFSTTLSCIIHYTFRENKVSLDAHPPLYTNRTTPSARIFEP